jgi:hypothetical protein
MKKTFYSIVLAVGTLIYTNATMAQSQAMHQFLEWESAHNIETSSQGVNFVKKELAIPYLEIDISGRQLYLLNNFRDWYESADKGVHGLTVDFADHLPDDIREFFKFQKNGKTFIRWPFNPLDEQFYKRTIHYLDELKIPHTFFSKENSQLRGYRTASKSMIIKLPNTERSFSFKTGTSTVGQNEGFDRPNPSRWAHFNRKLSDYYYTQRSQLKTLDVAWEAGAIMLPPFKPETDNSINIRLMESVSENKTYQLTGFVLKDKKEIQRIAKIAGLSADEFKKQISRHFGSFLVELNLILGFRVMSAHLQNVRFELDSQMRPTGKVILLDLTDGGPVRAIFEKNGMHQFLEDWQRHVAGTWIGSKDYTPNKIIDTPKWTQADMRADFPESAWFHVMNKAAMKEGAEERLKELGDFKGKVHMAKSGDLVMKFKDNADLLNSFHSNSNVPCSQAFGSIIGR